MISIAYVVQKLSECRKWALMALFTLLGISVSSAQSVTNSFVSPTTYSSVGDTLTFTVIMNSGNELVQNPFISSSSGLGISYSCSPTSSTTLNQTITCTGIYTVQATDQLFAGGQILEVATGNNRGNQYAPQAVMTATYVAGGNSPPTANAGTNQVVASGSSVNLLGSGSEPGDTGPVTFAWTGPVALTNANTATPSFTAPILQSDDVAQILTFTLTVTDNDGQTATDTVTVTVNPPANVAPIADAGMDQTVASGTAPVNLSGTGSEPDDNDPVTFAWTGPVALTNATTATPSFTAPTLVSSDPPQVLTFTLTVTDDDGQMASDTVDVTVNPPPDTTPPTVVISSSVTNHDGSTPFVATITFDENVNNFVDGDLTATNATVGPLSPAGGVGTVFTATITPTGPLDIVLGVGAAVAQDDAGNDNIAANDVTITGTVIELTQQTIASFLINRANQVLNNQPDLINFVTGENLGGSGRFGNLNINGNDDGMVLAFSTSRSKILAAQAKSRIDDAFDTSNTSTHPLKKTSSNAAPGNALAFTDNNSTSQKSENTEAGIISRAGSWDVWTEIYGATSNSGNSDSSLWVGYLGAHYFTSDKSLIGLVGQLDWADETNTTQGSKADGFGWMIGPYIAGQVGDQNLYYEARVGYGRSSNEISPIGTYTDSFDTERWLASGKLAGVYEFENMTIRPELAVSWYEETQEAYTDSLSNQIAEQTISLGELRFGPIIKRTMVLDDGTVFTPELGIHGVWNFDIESGLTSQATALGDDDLRARVDLGFTSMNPDTGVTISLSGYYDGIGISDYDAWGGKIRLTMPLQ